MPSSNFTWKEKYVVKLIFSQPLFISIVLLTSYVYKAVISQSETVVHMKGTQSLK